MARYQEEFETKGARFRIRNAEDRDAQSLIGFMRYVDRETTFLAREPGEFEASFPPEKEAALLKTWADGEEKLFLMAVTEAGEVAATCGCSYSDGRKRVRHLGEIAISVRQDFWRMGLGRRLFEIQTDWCRKNGVEKLKLTVDTLNVRAIGLYLSQGFMVEGVLRKEAKMADGSWRDVYCMAKFLK